MRVPATSKVSACGCLAITAALGACAPVPRLDVPPSVLSGDWSVMSRAPSAETTSLGAALGSPDLAAYIAQAMRQSPALSAANERIAQALAQLRGARSVGTPRVSLSPSAYAIASGGRLDLIDNLAPVDAALSLDLGGVARAGRRSARDRVAATRFDRQALRLQLAAEIARAWVQRAALARRLDLIDESIAQASKLARIIAVRVREGAANRVESGLADIRLRRLQADRLRLEQALDQTRTGLATLIGAEAPGFAAPLPALDRLVVGEIAPPRPSQLVVLRPDIRAAEARIAALGGDVAAARGAFLPQLDLSVARATGAGGGLLGGLAFGAELLQPIFGRGKLKAELDASAARQREAVQLYRQAVLQAFTETEDALSAADKLRRREDLLSAARRQAATTVVLARRQYLEGDADLQHLLDAEDLRIAADDDLALTRQARLEAAIALFRACRADI